MTEPFPFAVTACVQSFATLGADAVRRITIVDYHTKTPLINVIRAHVGFRRRVPCRMYLLRAHVIHLHTVCHRRPRYGLLSRRTLKIDKRFRISMPYFLPLKKIYTFQAPIRKPMFRRRSFHVSRARFQTGRSIRKNV